ncbi:tyrosine-type recombinase/integrase [Planotetraspora sp. GP83]|uniref:tyrosine-type recombinase/integrase n=1 Tax=Planotetraspora sp. GP83 TaxID=3156264 RepID=UPI0035198F1B
MSDAQLVIRPSGDAAYARPEPAYTATDFALSDETRELVLAGVADETRRAYDRHWRDFRTWCARQGRVPLPATPHTFTEYVREMIRAALAPASIEQAMSAIRTYHRTAGYKEQPDRDMAVLALRGYRKDRAKNGRRNQRQSPVLSVEHVQAMAGVCPDDPVGWRDRLALDLGIALMGRRSELVALHQADVRPVGDELEVLIRQSKTDQDAHGETVYIPPGEHPLTDPVGAWRRWTAFLAEHGHTGGRLLRRFYRNYRVGASLGGDAVNEIIRSLAIRAGIPSAEDVTAHSLRATGASWAYINRAPVSSITEHGRWDPESSVVLRYIRAVDKRRNNPMRGAGL